MALSEVTHEPEWLPRLHKWAVGRSGAQIPRVYGHGYYMDNPELNELYADHCADLMLHFRHSEECSAVFWARSSAHCALVIISERYAD